MLRFKDMIRILNEGRPSSSATAVTSAGVGGVASMASDSANVVSPGMKPGGGKPGKPGKGIITTARWNPEKDEFEEIKQVPWDVKVKFDSAANLVAPLFLNPSMIKTAPVLGKMFASQVRTALATQESEKDGFNLLKLAIQDELGGNAKISITNKKSDDGGEAQSSELPGHPGRFYPEMPPHAKDPFYWGPDGTPLVPDHEFDQPHQPQLKPWGRPEEWELPPAIVTAPGVKILSYPDGTIVVYIWVEGQGWIIISNGGGGYVAPWSEPDQGDDPLKQDPGMDPVDPDATDPFNPSGEPDTYPHLPWPTTPDQWDDPKYDPYA